MWPRRRYWRILLVWGAVVLAGCVSRNSASTGQGPASAAPASLPGTLVVRIGQAAPAVGVTSSPLAVDLPSTVVNVHAAVSSASASTQQTQTVPVAQGFLSFTDIASATDYSLELKALDIAGGTVCSGSASNLLVGAGQTTNVDVSITCTWSLSVAGQLTVTNIAATSLTLNWPAGSQSGLQYRVYRSQGDNLHTVAEVEANGTPLNAYQSGITSLNDASLTASTGYYYNVIAKDAAGAKGVFPELAVTTLPSGRVVQRMDPSGTLPVGFISSVTVDPDDYRTVYVTFSTFGVDHLWKSTDEGQTWSSLDGSGSTGIPDIPAQTLFIDPRNTQHLYLGTDLGVLFSADGGANWESINTNGMANVAVDHFAYQASTRRLFAFTHGRGVFGLTLP